MLNIESTSQKNGDLLIAEGNENEACHKLNKASAMLGADTEDAFT